MANIIRRIKYFTCFRCLNGGTCVDGVDSYSCSCPEGLLGRFCECIKTDVGDLNCNYIKYPLPNTSLPFTPISTPLGHKETDDFSSTTQYTSAETSYVQINVSVDDFTTYMRTINTPSDTHTVEDKSSEKTSNFYDVTTSAFSTESTLTPETPTFRTDVTLATIDLISGITEHTGSHSPTVTSPMTTAQESYGTETTLGGELLTETGAQSEVTPSTTSSLPLTSDGTTAESLYRSSTSDVELETRALPSTDKYTKSPEKSDQPETPSTIRNNASELPITLSTVPLPPSSDLMWTTGGSVIDSYATTKISSSSEMYTEASTALETCNQDACANGGTCYEEKIGVKVK